MPCPTNYALQLHKKASSDSHQATRADLRRPKGKPSSLTFSKLNESAVSGKWISNIFHKIITKKERVYIYKKKEKRKQSLA